jgi:hypothetical protein
MLHPACEKKAQNNFVLGLLRPGGGEAWAQANITFAWRAQTVNIPSATRKRGFPPRLQRPKLGFK